MINVITVNSGWILQKIAERTVAASNGRMRISPHPFRFAHNFYVDVQNCYHGPTGGIDIGLFTHVHENDAKFLDRTWFTLDHVIHMSKRNIEMWICSPQYSENSSASVSCKMPGEIPPGFSFKKRRIGIAQRGKYEGKGFHFMLEMIKRYPQTMAMFDWLFIGNDWNEVVDGLSKLTSVSVIKDSDAIWPDTYNRFYHEIDYLLIPSKWEGGPMSMIEAAASGVPIISAEVGWAGWEIETFARFAAGKVEELEAILNLIGGNQKKALDVVRTLSYKDFADHVIECFDMVQKEKHK